MPLPVRDCPWPPASERAPRAAGEVHRAWWAGDLDRLADLYGTTGGAGLPGTAGPNGGSLLSRARRWFTGQPAAAGTTTSRLHVPLAADICATSADLLFGTPLAVSVDDDRTQERLEEIVDGAGLWARLLEAAEEVAAIGGGYVRVGTVPGVRHPVFDAIPADSGVPVFTRGHLTAVTLSAVLERRRDGAEVWRHLEHHEAGTVEHGLFRGTVERLGVRLDWDQLAGNPTADAILTTLAAHGNPAGIIDTGAAGLAVEYVPNITPNRGMRGSPLGRSDLDGIEPTLDALDEAWTSWMRDIQLGKGRLLVPESYLDNLGAGRGANFDGERSVFTALSMMEQPNNPVPITLSQFAIRAAEHAATTDALTRVAVNGAGYSPSTFGLDSSAAMTATEVNSRRERSTTTRARKATLWRYALRRLLLVALEQDARFFGTGGLLLELPDVTFPDRAATDPEGEARTLQLLHAAGAISTAERVRRVNPGWDDAQVRAERDALLVEAGAGPDVMVQLEAIAAGEELADLAAEAADRAAADTPA